MIMDNNRMNNMHINMKEMNIREYRKNDMIINIKEINIREYAYRKKNCHQRN